MVQSKPAGSPFFRTRGIVLTPGDLTLADWPDRAHAAGLTTLALHPTPSVVTAFVRTARGEAFLERCRELGLQVEYELHAMAELLPRDLFAREPGLFRMGEDGRRVPDANLCVHSRRALDIAAENAVRIGRVLRPTTGRFFYWGDDGAAWCRCPECRGLLDSDQALLLTNHLVGALRRLDAHAQVAHLAYHNTIAAPAQVRPAPGVFLEFAPIHRRYDAPYASQTARTDADRLDLLDANLAVFPRQTAQALEYWLDLSRFAGWKRPAPRLPWRPDVFAADLQAYGSRGVRHLTSFGVYLDADYVRGYGDPPVGEYGARMQGWRPGRRKAPRRGGTADHPSWQASLSDPFRDRLLGAGDMLPERAARCAEPLQGEPAFDPELIRRQAAAICLPPGLRWESPLLERSVRVGLAHIDATFEGDHPRYGVGAYAAPEHDGFPPTIIAAVDALTLWGHTERAEQLFGYWLDHFVRPDGSLAYYGPSLSEHGQLLTSARRLMERGGSKEWLARCSPSLSRLCGHILGLWPGRPGVSLLSGSPEADTATDRATYFHNNAWLWRGLRDWAAVLKRSGGDAASIGAAAKAAAGLRPDILTAIADAWPHDPADWWLRPMAEKESAGPFERPYGRVTASRLGSYTNYRYWPELLSSGVLPARLVERVVHARLSGGGQLLGMTRFEEHLDDWPLVEYLEGLWSIGRKSDYRLCLWGHILYHQAEGHLTAYEQVTFPPGRKSAEYCLPCQLVAARAARRLV